MEETVVGRVEFRMAPLTLDKEDKPKMYLQLFSVQLMIFSVMLLL